MCISSELQEPFGNISLSSSLPEWPSSLCLGTPPSPDSLFPPQTTLTPKMDVFFSLY